MKRTISLWLGLPAAAGLLAFALLPAIAQTPGPTGKIHGHVTNPTGASQAGGTVTLVGVDRIASGPGLSAQMAEKGSFPVDANGDYTGQAAPGTYFVIYRSPGTPADKVTDKFDNVKILLGQDVLQDIDMSRKEYIDTLTPDQKKQLEDLRKHNSEAMKANAVVNNLNADIRVTTQDIKDADAARATAVQTLGATASRADLEAKEAEIKTAKYTEIEALMLKDTGLKPNESSLWAWLGQAQVGLKKYDEAEATYKKVLELETTAKIPEANAAYDAAAKANPAGAGTYLTNEAAIFSNLGNGDAQVAAANEAIKIDPTQPLPYYLKGQGLIQKATIDAKTGKMILPPGCAEAYLKYLELAPTGLYAADVKAILAEAGQTHSSVYGPDKPKKSK
jgi:tetratricopeptide (TPR) repeat protein